SDACSPTWCRSISGIESTEPHAPHPRRSSAASTPLHRRWSGRLGTLAVAVEDHDAMGPFSALMLTGLAVAGILAIIGGMPFDTPVATLRCGWVAPTCGLTRGSTAIARGALGRAWAYTPASFLVMGVGLLGVARLGWGCATGRWLTLRP